jgi:CSLREA domain-containing protein
MKRRWQPGVVVTWALAPGVALGAAGCGRLGFEDDAVQPGPPAALALTYPFPTSYHALLNETQLQISPVFKGLETFTVSPPLPQGLQLGERSGEIFGIPSEVSDRRRYVVTGKGPDGELSAELYLTALPGWKVTAFSDWADDNNGVGTCLATMAGGCTLRAAIQTANQLGDKRMILVPQGRYPMSGELNVIDADLVIVGAGVGATIVEPAAPNPGYRMMSFSGSARQVRLEQASFRKFGAQDGGVLQVNRGRLEVFHAEFSGNSSNSTGGVMCVDGGGQALLENVSFFDNEAVLNEARGGVLNASSPGTKITVVKSTAIGNRAALGSFAWADSSSMVEIINSTLTGNVATEAAALAAYQANITVRSSTVFANTTTSNVTAALGIGMGASSITLANTIVAANTSTADGAQHNCATETASSSLLSLGGNLFSNDADGCKDLMAARPLELNARLLLDTDAKENGGPTRTVALLPGSAAIDRGLAEHCPEHDQRGVKRRPGEAGACDVGAYELE